MQRYVDTGLFSVYFRSFQTNITIFTTNHCEKMSCQYRIQCWDSNPRPSEYESPPITTREGVPPKNINLMLIVRKEAPTDSLIN